MIEVRVGRRRTITIPKKVADLIGLREGQKLLLKVEDKKIILEPIIDAVWLALHGEKIVEITLRELEEESIEQQKKYIEQA